MEVGRRGMPRAEAGSPMRTEDFTYEGKRIEEPEKPKGIRYAYTIEKMNLLRDVTLSAFEIEEFGLTNEEKVYILHNMTNVPVFDTLFNFVKEAGMAMPSQDRLDEWFTKSPGSFYDFVKIFEYDEEKKNQLLERFQPEVSESILRAYEKKKNIDKRMMEENESERAEQVIQELREAGEVLGNAMVEDYDMNSEQRALEERRMKEEEMLFGKIRIAKPVGEDSQNTPYRVWFEDDSDISAVAKSRARESRWLKLGIDQYTYANREWLAYQIARALQIKEVPTTVFGVTGIEGLGSLQKWEDNSKPAALVSNWNKLASKSAVERGAVMHLITGIADGHSGNMLVSFKEDADGKEMRCIDFGLIFSENHDSQTKSVLISSCVGKPVSQEVIASIRQFKNSLRTQEALRHIFELALHEDAETAWGQFQDALSLFEPAEGETEVIFPNPIALYIKTWDRVGISYSQ